MDIAGYLPLKVYQITKIFYNENITLIKCLLERRRSRVDGAAWQWHRKSPEGRECKAGRRHSKC